MTLYSRNSEKSRLLREVRLRQIVRLMTQLGSLRLKILKLTLKPQLKVAIKRLSEEGPYRHSTQFQVPKAFTLRVRPSCLMFRLKSLLLMLNRGY